jgi:hypothetical protein
MYNQGKYNQGFQGVSSKQWEMCVLEGGHAGFPRLPTELDMWVGSINLPTLAHMHTALHVRPSCSTQYLCCLDFQSWKKGRNMSWQGTGVAGRHVSCMLVACLWLRLLSLPRCPLQGRTWLAPPREKRNEADNCFLPKRWVHTWEGHKKGVNAIRFFPKTGHLMLSAGEHGDRCCLRHAEENTVRVVKGTQRFQKCVAFAMLCKPGRQGQGLNLWLASGFTESGSTQRPCLSLFGCAALLLCRSGRQGQDLGCVWQQEVHAHLPGS